MNFECFTIALMSPTGQIRPWCSTGVDDGLSPDSGRSAETLVTAGLGRVEMWRGCFSPNISVAASFAWRGVGGSSMTRFPPPAHRTGHHVFPHRSHWQRV